MGFLGAIDDAKRVQDDDGTAKKDAQSRLDDDR